MASTIFNARPRDIHRYSIFKDCISFDFFSLHPYHIKESFRPGPNHGEEHPSMRDNYKQFKHHVLDDQIPLTSKLQWTLLDYESKNNLDFLHNSNITEIYCHNGLFTDLMTRKLERYRCIKHNNKLFISNTSTRKNQDRVLCFIGARFETFVTNQRIPKHDKDHYKALLEGNWGKWKYKSVVEIDAYKVGEDGKKIEDMTEEERLKSYAEIKLCSAYNIKEEQVKQIKNKQEFLTILSKQVKKFKQKLEQWLYQSYFGRQDTLVIGVRNRLFELMCYEEIDMFEDLLPFVKTTYPDVYAKFLNSPEILERELGMLYEGAIDEVVMEFTTNDQELALSPANTKYVKRKNLLVPGILRIKSGSGDENETGNESETGNDRWKSDRSLKLATKREETKESQYLAEGEAEAEARKAELKKNRPKRPRRRGNSGDGHAETGAVKTSSDAVVVPAGNEQAVERVERVDNEKVAAS